VQLNGSLYIRSDVDKRLRENLCITDAKSLYDSLAKEAKGKEPRIDISTAEIKQSMAAVVVKQRWIPHNEMICDPLTKSFGKANLRALLATMRSGKLKLGSEKDELNYRKSLKEEGKAVPRKKGVGQEHDHHL
jgi:hypothetical protein